MTFAQVQRQVLGNAIALDHEAAIVQHDLVYLANLVAFGVIQREASVAQSQMPNGIAIEDTLYSGYHRGRSLMAFSLNFALAPFTEAVHITGEIGIARAISILPLDLKTHLRLGPKCPAH